jgi:hypothetical protein
VYLSKGRQVGEENHPEWEKEKKMEKTTEKYYPDLLSRWLKPMTENKRQ